MAMVMSHYSDVIMGAMTSQITSLTIVYSTAYSKKTLSSAPLAIVRKIHRWPVNSPHKWPVTRRMFPFDDVIMCGARSNRPNSRPERCHMAYSISISHTIYTGLCCALFCCVHIVISHWNHGIYSPMSFRVDLTGTGEITQLEQTWNMDW